jgi:hypothetical protein
VDFLAGGELVARYHVRPDLYKPYFWPVNAPGAIPVTRAWPMEKARPGQSTDHVHQKSLWFCHGDVLAEGLGIKPARRDTPGVDFWSEGKGAGRIVCVGISQPKKEKGKASLVTHNEWRSPEGRKILDETRVISFFDFGSARLLVLDIDLLASQAPLVFGDTKEGTLGVRVNDQMREIGGKGRLENAEGKIAEKGTWGLHSAWSDYSGLVDGQRVGIAVFDDPSNPSPIAWHNRGYGLMSANPFGRAKAGFPAAKGSSDVVKVPQGEHLKLRYGVLIHLGNAREGKVAEHYKEFLKRR